MSTTTDTSTTDAPVTTGLTAIEIAALRKADSICFDLHQRPGEDITSGIRAIKRVEQTATDPYAQDITIMIRTEYAVWDYAAEHGISDAQHAGFYMIHSAGYSETWQTIASLLRAGDQLTLSWFRNNASESIRDAGLVADELRLRVQRGKRRLVFLICRQVGADNTARLIRVR